LRVEGVKGGRTLEDQRSKPNLSMFNFEKLETWHEAIAFADLLYTLTREFPDEERFGLKRLN
jgi:hypothetical protein